MKYGSLFVMQLSTKGNKTVEVIGFLKGGTALWRRVAGTAEACVCTEGMEDSEDGMLWDGGRVAQTIYTGKNK